MSNIIIKASCEIETSTMNQTEAKKVSNQAEEILALVALLLITHKLAPDEIKKRLLANPSGQTYTWIGGGGAGGMSSGAGGIAT